MYKKAEKNVFNELVKTCWNSEKWKWFPVNKPLNVCHSPWVLRRWEGVDNLKMRALGMGKKVLTWIGAQKSFIILLNNNPCLVLQGLRKFLIKSTSIPIGFLGFFSKNTVALIIIVFLLYVYWFALAIFPRFVFFSKNVSGE